MSPWEWMIVKYTVVTLAGVYLLTIVGAIGLIMWVAWRYRGFRKRG